MTDRTSLDLIGFIFCGLTALVIVIAVLVVGNHLDGRLTLDGSQHTILSASLPSVATTNE